MFHFILSISQNWGSKTSLLSKTTANQNTEKWHALSRIFRMELSSDYHPCLLTCRLISDSEQELDPIETTVAHHCSDESSGFKQNLPPSEVSQDSYFSKAPQLVILRMIPLAFGKPCFWPVVLRSSYLKPWLTSLCLLYMPARPAGVEDNRMLQRDTVF